MTILKLFGSEAKWVDHLRAAHSPGGSWVCRMTPHKDRNLNSSNVGPIVVLNTENDFRNHLETEHVGMYPKSRIDAIVKNAWRPQQAKVEDMFRDECPMRCPASMETSPEKAIVLGVPHVANHLLSLALEALPERSVRSSKSQFVDDDDDDDDKRVARDKIRDGLEELPDPEFEDPFEGSLLPWDPERGVEGSEELPPPPPSDGAPSGPLEITPKTDGRVNDRVPLLGGARLRYYGFLPLIERQHRELDDISQIKDPTMETFLRKQKGADDLSLFLLQALKSRARRRYVHVTYFRPYLDLMANS